MTGGSHIAAVGPEKIPAETPVQTADTAEDAVMVLEESFEEVYEEASPRNLAWAVPALAVLAIVGWSVFFAFAQRGIWIDGVAPSEASAMVVQWTVPVLLVVGLWLLAMRSSRREASRFGDAARVLRDESVQLESRLVTINRELSMARDFLAAQSRDLESLGRVASERLSANAERMSAMIYANSEQIDSIASVSTTALENMDKLRGDLPVVANAARDVTSQIGNAGRTAQTHLEELIAGLHRVNTFGEAGTRLIGGLQQQIDSALAAFESRTKGLGDTTIGVILSLNDRLATLESECTSMSASIREGESVALAQWQTAIENTRSTLVNALQEISEIDSEALGRIQARLKAIDEESKQVDTVMEERMQRFIAGVDEGRARHETHMAEIAETIDARTSGLSQISDTLGSIAGHSKEIGGELAQAVEELSAKLTTNKAVLEETDGAVASLTDASVRLLELIQAGSEHSREQLPAALEAAEQRLGEFEARSLQLGVVLGDAAARGEALSSHVASAQNGSSAMLGELEALHTTLAQHEASHASQIRTLRDSLAALAGESGEVSQRAEGDLSEAIGRLQGALRETLDDLGNSHSGAIDGLAERIGEQSAEMIERVIRLRATEAIDQLEQAAAQASGTGRDAARQLRDQLAKVDELASNLESRVARARERAEEQVDNDFSRRVALITESLNSNSIDIAKALSNDVTDTAWASYLRGDRGIFTRRAVRLLDNSEAREIAEIYDRDHDFREHVSRYIHDFEAMLRTMLSTRDGHALSVTLLSSDMGKLYVALAQAIERLRD